MEAGPDGGSAEGGRAERRGDGDAGTMLIALIALKFVYFLAVCLHLSTDCFLLPQTLERKARAILNKLTPQKFDTLVGKFQELGINTEDKLQRCVGLTSKETGHYKFCLGIKGEVHL